MTTRAPLPPAILRISKLHTFTELASSAAHTWRTQSVPHADPARTYLNEDWRDIHGPSDLCAAVKVHLSPVDYLQSNAVICLEYLITASRQAFSINGGETDAQVYFRDSVKFLENRHGKANVIAINIQHDESAPHLVAYVVPLVEHQAHEIKRSVFAPGRKPDGKQNRTLKTIKVPAHIALSAAHYTGTPEKMRRLQTDFVELVARHHSLRRGLEYSAATHTTNRAFHDAVARAFASHLHITPDDLERRGRLWNRESPVQMAQRLSDIAQENYAPIIASAATAEHDRRRAREMEETALRHRDRYDKECKAHEVTRQTLDRLTNGLLPNQVQSLEHQASQYRRSNKLAAQEKARRREAEQAALQHQKEQQLKAAHQAEQAREEEIVAKLCRITPRELAQTEHKVRHEYWCLMLKRVELEEVVIQMIESGLFEASGHLSSMGHNLIAGMKTSEASSPQEDLNRALNHKAPDTNAIDKPGSSVQSPFSF